jgi:hypothetical protein
MRRQKEIASQMGIDVAWNCAISLRPLEGDDLDPHRMVSNYADWDVNAKLPHGIENVRQHLKDVDNVPLLVSLFTDVTKETTKDMVSLLDIFACRFRFLLTQYYVFFRLKYSKSTMILLWSWDYRTFQGILQFSQVRILLSGWTC